MLIGGFLYDQSALNCTLTICLYDTKTIANLEITGIKFSPFKSTDVLVDVFDDGIMSINRVVYGTFDDKAFGGIHPLTQPLAR